MPLKAETRKFSDGCGRVSGRLTRCMEAFAKDPESEARCFDFLEDMRKCCADYGAVSTACRGWLAERRKIEAPQLNLETVVKSTMIDKYQDRLNFSPAEVFADSPF